MAVSLLSLAGIPPLAGFVGKVLVIQAAIATGHAALAVLAIVTSVVAVVYYARVVVAMYVRDPSGAARTPERRTARPLGIALGIAVVGTIVLGLVPGLWYGLVDHGQNLLVFVSLR